MINDFVHLDIPAAHAWTHIPCVCVKAWVERLQGVDDAQAISNDLQVALQEVLVNIIDHGHIVSAGRINIRLAWDGERRQCVLQTCDHGKPINIAGLAVAHWKHIEVDGFEALELVLVDEPAWDQERGRGLFLMWKLVDHVRCWSADDANHWQLVKTISRAGE